MVSHYDFQPTRGFSEEDRITGVIDWAEAVVEDALFDFAVIGIRRTHARTPVILLIADLNIRVVNAATGELIRALTLTLDPTTGYQPTGKTRNPKRRTPPP